MYLETAWEDLDNMKVEEMIEAELPFTKEDECADHQEYAGEPDDFDCDTPECYVPIERAKAYELIGGLIDAIFTTDLEMIRKHYELLQYFDEEHQRFMRSDVIYPTYCCYCPENQLYRQYVRDCRDCVDPLESDAATGRRLMVSRGIPDAGPEGGAAYWRSLWDEEDDDDEEYDFSLVDPKNEYFPYDDENWVDSDEVWKLVMDMIQDFQVLFAELVTTRYRISMHLGSEAREEAIDHLLDGLPDFYGEYAAYQEFVHVMKEDPMQNSAWKKSLYYAMHGGITPRNQRKESLRDEMGSFWNRPTNHPADQKDGDSLTFPERTRTYQSDPARMEAPEDSLKRVSRILERELHYLNGYLELRGLMDEYRLYRMSHKSDQPLIYYT